MSFSLRNISTPNIPIYNSSSILSIPISTVKPNNDETLVYDEISNNFVFSSGITGPTGVQGFQGFQGIIGLTGPPGTSANTGATGVQGNQGLIGPTGVQGYQGLIGPTGVQGNQGLIGPTGVQGYQGLIGPTGVQGNQGLIGPTGVQGYQGLIGPTGVQGYQGLIGPTGVQGYQGLIGPTGVQGNQGLIGPTGVQGNQGLIGPTGVQGYQGLIGPTGVQGNQGIIGPTGVQGNIPVGNTIQVDSVYGNDATGASSPYSRPFLTITAALSYAQSGQLVFINPGTYNESITIPDNVSVSGAGAQCVIIQKLNVTQNTTLITVGNNCRLENFTANLTSSGNYDLTCINFPSGTSITAKIRNSIWNVTSTATGTPTIIGAKSAGTSSTSFTAVNAIQRTSINVISDGNGVSRGILVSGPNRFAVRDIVVYARGNGTNIVGVETTDANAYAEIKTTTVSGVLYDINRTAGDILIGFTDLRNNRANGNSFSVVTESSTTTFGFIGNPGSNTTYHLVPGVLPIGSLPSTDFQIPISQNMILFTGILRFTGTIGSGASISLNIYKNLSVSPVYSIVLNAGDSTNVNNTTSVDFSSDDVYSVRLITVGNPGSGTCTATLSFY
jgi:hypothetical protein